MKSYVIKVNGVSYDVEVEDKGGSVSSAPAPAKAAPSAAPKAAPKSSGSAGSTAIAAGAAGKVFRIEKNVGDSVSKGDTVIIIEAMKMEIPVVAPSDGTVASIDCSVGDPCESGQTLATLK